MVGNGGEGEGCEVNLFNENQFFAGLVKGRVGVRVVSSYEGVVIFLESICESRH